MSHRTRLPAPRRAATLAALWALAAGGVPAAADAQSVFQPATAVARATASQPVEIELRSATRVLVPGETAAVAIRLRPEPGWHTYWRHAGDVGSPPSVEWQLPEGFTADPLRWPAPELIASPPLASYGYEREVHLLGAVHVPSTARVGSTATLRGTINWVVCREECFAADVDLALTLPVGAAAEADTAAARAFAAEDARVPARPAGWAFQSAVDAGAIVLRVRPPAESGLLAAGDAVPVRFFVDSAGVIDHAAPAAVRVDGDALELRLTRSPYASGTPTRLTGVLAFAGAGSGDQGLAVEVDAPVVSMAQLAPAGGAGGASGGRWLALLTAGLLALLGGTLLNLMPCVLPVLSIKALGVAEAAAHDGRTARRHALYFAAGVLASMWALVGMLLALRAAGAEVGWGYQLQSPAMVGALALIVFAAALNMAGVFELAPVGGTLSVAATRTPPAAEAFLSGVLVTALATPCSAPFLAAAVAYGIAGGAASAIVVFTALGLGLVWPLALVAAAPGVRRWLPKPGAWMVTLRQALAFPLFATVVWLAWVLGRQAGTGAVTVLLGALTLLAFGLWALGRFGTLVASAGRRRAARGVALAAGAGALALVITGARSVPSGAAVATAAASPAAGALPWRPYSAAALQALRDSGRVVLLDFTADWCLTCQVNERVAFNSDAVRASLRAHDVALLRADWTTRDPSITRALAEFNRNSVPFVVLYGRDRAAEPAVLPTLLTPGIVTRALDAAAAGPAPALSVAPAR
ncbi:protein-disulfide reductase DsbD family protein [Longimicrobium sp.]|uniref:protein-disulfide reductase DsbD family protein n=1 Tax=Longimicrobium sp. TaxID=2029185 RepID=UPI003B3AE701